MLNNAADMLSKALRPDIMLSVRLNTNNLE